MRYIYLSLLIAIGIARAGNELTVVNSVTTTDLLRVTKDGVSNFLQAREFSVTARYPSGKEAPRTLLVFFDPYSRFYVWTITWAKTKPTEEDPLEYLASRSALNVSDGRIVWFIMGQSNLYVTESAQQASDLDDAGEKALREATAQLSRLEHYAPRQELEIEIGKELGNVARSVRAHFFAPSSRVDPGPFPVRVEAAYSSGRWEVVIEANLKAKVTLDDRLELLKVEPLPKR